MENEELNKIIERLNSVVEKYEKGIKRRYDEEWARGFMIALVDHKVITEDEYRKIRDSIDWKMI
ncbi:hypothetical protein DRN58_06545 [Thermococci archaeon]|nr:MAG: hypothetical protein DRN58_06545 [Thermococci archaeon]